MSYLQIHFLSDAAHAELVEELLFAVGAHTVSLSDAEDEPILEPAPNEVRLWSKTIVTGLFDEGIDYEALVQTINAQLPARQVTLHQIEPLADKDWARVWLEHFKPMRFGESLWVVPTAYDAPEEGVVIHLDPGLAFGTGTHPTTAMCLHWIDGADLRDKSVIDYGCGSGILGLAAIKKGADKVIGVDIDPQALTATQNNLTRNDLPSDAMLVFLPEDCPQISADIVFANILSGPLIELAPQISSLLKPTGRVLLSGILNEQVDDVIAAYSRYFKVEKYQHIGDWFALTGTR